MKDKDKPAVIPIARKLAEMGFNLVATEGTKNALEKSGIPVRYVKKVKEGRPHIVDLLKNGEIDLVINTTLGKQSAEDSYSLRRTTLVNNIPYCTTVSGAFAAVTGIEELRRGSLDVMPLQEYYKK